MRQTSVAASPAKTPLLEKRLKRNPRTGRGEKDPLPLSMGILSFCIEFWTVDLIDFCSWKSFMLSPSPRAVVEEHNAYAVGVWRRVKVKLEGRDPDVTRRAQISEQVGARDGGYSRWNDVQFCIYCIIKCMYLFRLIIQSRKLQILTTWPCFMKAGHHGFNCDIVNWRMLS